MHVITLVFGIIAAVLFGVDYARSKALIALGLCLLTITLIFAFTLTGEDVIYFIE